MRSYPPIYSEIAAALDSHNLDHTLLKGFSSCPDFCPDPRSRVQYDIDLLFSPEEAERARDILIPLGYESLASSDSIPTDHLPTLLRKAAVAMERRLFRPRLASLRGPALSALGRSNRSDRGARINRIPSQIANSDIGWPHLQGAGAPGCTCVRSTAYAAALAPGEPSSGSWLGD